MKGPLCHWHRLASSETAPPAGVRPVPRPAYGRRASGYLPNGALCIPPGAHGGARGPLGTARCVAGAVDGGVQPPAPGTELPPAAAAGDRPRASGPLGLRQCLYVPPPGDVWGSGGGRGLARARLVLFGRDRAAAARRPLLLPRRRPVRCAVGSAAAAGTPGPA